jgi:hypothetical protein
MARASDEHSDDLVEPEGVNAASDRVGASHDEGDVVSGGRPEAAPDDEQASVDGSADLVAAPEGDEREPSQPHGESGQDSGLMG